MEETCTSATAAATSTHGWRKIPRPAAVQLDRLSSLDIQVGGLCGRPARRCRWTAMRMRMTPRAILMPRAALDGAVLGLGGFPPVIRMTPPITTTNDASQPRMKAAPFLAPWMALKVRMKAMMGMGSRVTASPMRTRSTNTTVPVRTATGPFHPSAVPTGGTRHRMSPRGCPGHRSPQLSVAGPAAVGVGAPVGADVPRRDEASSAVRNSAGV